MERRIIVIVTTPGALALDAIAPADVFSFANSITENGNPGIRYEVIIASGIHELHVTTSCGLTIACKTSVYAITERIDTLIVAGFAPGNQWKQFPELIGWLQQQSGKVRRLCSVCLGAFALAEAGLLKGKRATTHWRFCTQLRTSYKGIKVDPDPMFMKDGKIYTSAGVTAGFDLSMALVEEDHGPEVALAIAQNLVMPLRRMGNQSQFGNLPLMGSASKGALGDLQKWAVDNLKKELTVEVLAERVKMSPRNFARVFVKETGFSPAKYIERVRIESAKRFLEETTWSLEKIASHCGFGSVDSMRRIFVRNIHSTPYEYRNLFGSAKQSHERFQ